MKYILFFLPVFLQLNKQCISQVSINKDTLITEKNKTYHYRVSGIIEYRELYDNNKIKMEGYYIHSKRDSIWKFYYPNGYLSSIEHWKNDKIWEVLQCYRPNGQECECGNLKNGNGYILKYYSNKNISFKAKYINGLKDGPSIYYNKDSSIYIIENY